MTTAALSQPDPRLSYEEYVELQLRKTRTMTGYDPGERTKSLIRVLARFVPPAPGTRVLCVGARNRYELDYMTQAGYVDVSAIDLMSADPRIRVMDMQSMTFSDASFDVVFAAHSLEHALDPRIAAQEFQRVCRPGGHIVIEVPIGVGRKGPDLWDFGSAAGVAALFDACSAMFTEHGTQILSDPPQGIARVVLRRHG